jgi:hypothetical protein
MELARQQQQAAPQGEMVEKRGWFLKKRKRRYCVLRNHVLMWFVNESDSQQHSLSISAAAQKVSALRGEGHMKGSLDLRECVVTAQGFDLAIRSKEVALVLLLAAALSPDALFCLFPFLW